MTKRICKQCGKEFYVVPSQVKYGGGKFCSSKCFYKWNKGKNHCMWKEKIKKICPICKKNFEVYPSLKKIRFCSRKCYEKWYSKTKRGKNNANWKPKIKCTCKNCGKTFYVYPYRVKDGNGIFCCSRCTGIWNYKHHKNKDTSIELKIEDELKRRNIYYQKQIPLCSVTVVDFYLPQWRIVIYCDGDYWHSKPGAKERDNNQDFILSFNGFNVFRFTGSEIRKSSAKCIQKILQLTRGKS